MFLHNEKKGAVSFFIDIIKTRRSIRAYLDKPVPREILDEIIECARFSPTALGREPWYFTVITNRDLIKEIVEEIKKKLRLLLKLRFMLRPLYPDLSDKKFLSIVREKAYSREDRIFYNAPVLIIISAPRKNPQGLKDCLLAAENIMLASHAMDLGTCMIGFAEPINKSRFILKKLRLPPGHKIQATIVLGWPKSPNFTPAKKGQTPAESAPLRAGSTLPIFALPQRRRDNLTIL